MRIPEQTKHEIAKAQGNPKDVAERFGVSVSSVYNYRARFADQAEPPDVKMNAHSTVFDQRAKSGLIRSAGEIQEEFLRELQDDGGAKIYTEMSAHPVVAAVLFAIQMAQRKVNWIVEPAGEEEQDEKAAEFLEQCMDDMSQTWDDVVSQVFTMLKYGFSAAEIVYKKRLGQKPHKYTDDPGTSRFSDGLIGWRRFQFVSPRTLAPGNRWQFDEQGRVLSLTQQPPPTYTDITIPVQKLLLFRTKVEWDNPEGYSILRPMYQPWYYAQNLGEIEAISAERNGTGFPVVYMGRDVKKGDGGDLGVVETWVKNIRADEQMGLAIPYPKLGTAGEGEGMLFEFVSPPGKGPVDFDKVIDRYEKRMAMTVLAQFIFLGMTSTGTQALAHTTVDVFQEAIAAWSTMMADVINRFAVPRLFALNPFNIDELPKLKHSAASVPNLAEIASYVNSLVGAQVITPDEQLEKHLRAMADLPEKPEEAVEIVEPEQEQPEPELDEDEADESVEVEEEPEEQASERFALKTIRGALARDDAGQFARGSGPPASESDIRTADALLNARMTPAQLSQFKAAGLVGERDGKNYLTPEGRGVQRLMATNPRAALARMRTALKKAGPTRAKTTQVKPGEKRPGLKVSAKGGGGGKGKGKGKGAAKKGGGGGGKAKEEEKAKLGEEQVSRVDKLVEMGVPENLAVALSLIYDSEGPNATAAGTDPEIVAQLQELGYLDQNDQGDPVVSESGRRLTNALREGDDEVVQEEIEGKFAEDFGGAGSGNWGHKGTPGSRGGSAPRGGIALTNVAISDSEAAGVIAGYKNSEGMLISSSQNVTSDVYDMGDYVVKKPKPGNEFVMVEYGPAQEVASKQLDFVPATRYYNSRDTGPVLIQRKVTPAIGSIEPSRTLDDIRSSSIQAGYTPSDLHWGNVAVDSSGNTWAYDIDRWEFPPSVLNEGRKLRKERGLEGSSNKSEDFATRSKPGNPTWERETTAYEQTLRSEYNGWADATATELVKIDDEAKFQDYLDDAVLALIVLLSQLGRKKLPDAHRLGLAGVPASPEGIQQLASVIASNDELLQNSLGPDIRDKVLQRIEDDELIKDDKDSLRAILGTFLARVGTYAGPFWGLIGWGFVDRLRQMVSKPRVRAVLDPRAKHCQQCPEYAGEYENIDELIARTQGVPARWSSDCGCNCRCWIEYEKSPGVWARM